MAIERVDRYLDARRDQFEEQLKELVRIPSVSARSEHKPDMAKCAEAVKQRLLDAGVDKAEIYLTAGHPVVYGEKIIDRSKPTVLVYGHYDVQPVDPLNLWKTPPFEPCIETLPDGRKIIVARGACDDKGQAMTFIEACRAFKDVTESVARVLAVLAAITLSESRAWSNLERALASRDLIGQAKGIIMQARRVTAAEAFALLIRRSQETNTKLVEVAEAVVTTGIV